MKLSLPVGTTYLPVGTYTLTVGTTYLLVVTNYYNIPNNSFHFEIEPDQGELSRVVMETILGEPRIHVPNVLPTHPILLLDSDFIPFDDSLGSDLEVSFPFGSRNKIFDPGIFFEDCPDYEDSPACGFVHHSIFNPSHAYIWESDIRDLIDLAFIY
ncbi:hypothetical protein Tco_1516785 [Tanacetum coccineum]